MCIYVEHFVDRLIACNNYRRELKPYKNTTIFSSELHSAFNLMCQKKNIPVTFRRHKHIYRRWILSYAESPFWNEDTKQGRSIRVFPLNEVRSNIKFKL